MNSESGGPRPWAVDPDTLAELRLQKARDALKRHDADLALVEAEELLDDHPQHLDAQRVVGKAALELGDAGMAKVALEVVHARHPEDLEVLEGLAVARFALADFEGALEASRAAIRLDPTRAQAHYYEGLVLERGDEPEAAALCFARANAANAALFPLPIEIEDATWESALKEARRVMPGPFRTFYVRVPLVWERFPDASELRVPWPPLSPFSYALYEGRPPEEGDPWTELPAAVRLFRGNLRHGLTDVRELSRRIADALMQEAAVWVGQGLPDDGG